MRPKNRKASEGLPKSVTVRVVVGREFNAPEGQEPASGI